MKNNQVEKGIEFWTVIRFLTIILAVVLIYLQQKDYELGYKTFPNSPASVSGLKNFFTTKYFFKHDSTNNTPDIVIEKATNQWIKATFGDSLTIKPYESETGNANQQLAKQIAIVDSVFQLCKEIYSSK